MGLVNIGDDDYHIYDVDESKISSISFTTPTASCPPKTVYRKDDCGAGIKKDFEELDGTAPTINADKKQTSHGQSLMAQLFRGLDPSQSQDGFKEWKVAAPFVGNQPKWEYEYHKQGENTPSDSVAFWVKEQAATIGLNLEDGHARKIGDSYLLVGSLARYKDKIDERGKQLLIQKSDKGAYLFKSYDFAYQTALRLYGIKKNLQYDYLLKSQIWLRPTLITTDDGTERTTCDITTDKGVEKRCAKAFIFINPKKSTVGGIGPSFHVRIDQLITSADIQSIKDKFPNSIPTTNASFDTWAQNVALEYQNYITPSVGGGGFNPSVHNGEENFRIKAGLSSTSPGELYLGYGFSYGSEGSTDGRIAFREPALVVLLNPNNIAANREAIKQRRARMKEFDENQRAAHKAFVDAQAAAISAGGPAAPTTDTSIDLTQPIVTEYPTRKAISGPTSDAQGKAADTVNPGAIFTGD